MKSDIEHFKYLFQIEDDGGIGGKCTCVLLIAINKEGSNSKTAGLFCLALGKRKLEIVLFPAQSYTYLLINLLNTWDRKSPIVLYWGPWMQGD